MKKSIFRLAALSLLALGACQQRELDPVIIVESRVMTFTAGLADEADTRTQFEFVDASTFNVQWSPNDAINIFYGDAGSTPGSRFESLNTEPAETATFTGTINSFTGLDESGEVYQFWGVYPYSTDNRCDGESVQVGLPTIQNAVAGNIDSNTTLMVAKASGLALPFYNVWAVFRVRLTNTDIKSITLRGNNGEIMSGRVSVTMGSDGKPVWTSIPGQGKTYVTLKAPEGTTLQNGQDYYIAFLPQTFSNGFTFSFHKSNGEFGSYKITSSQTLERSKRYNLLNKDGGTNVNYFGYVDMGNGLKIATVNIGGNAPEDAGDKFAWGETTTKSTYSWENYFWGAGGSALTKYTASDGKTVLDPEDDPATVICGEDWRTPTLDEWKALLENTVEVYSSTNKTVSLVSSDNSKSIKLFASNRGTTYYWSSTLSATSINSGYVLRASSAFDASTVATGNSTRYSGYYIRPIYARVFVQSVSLSQNTLELYEGQSATLTAIIEPENATKKNVIWESDNPNVATVDENGTVTAIAEGETTIFVSTVDGDCTAECTVTVTPLMVQMGNGYWAISNIGAESPEDPGDPYAWGEIETKATYSWENYKWMMNGQTEGRYITKYQYLDGNTDAIWYNKNGGFIGDGWSILRSEDDVANQKLGDNWHIPSETQWLWLRDNCEWVYDTEKSGFWVISQASGFEGNKIFLPFSRSVQYWSSTIYGYNSTYAQGLSFNSPLSLSQFASYRCQSFYIRPIYSDKKQVGQVTLNKTALTFNNIGDTEALTAGVLPSDALEAGVVWSSTDPSIAKVDRLGTVTAVSYGVTTIRARSVADYTKTATCTVSVGYPVTGVTLNKTSVRLITSKTTQLTATISPTNAANKAVTWSTSNSSVATVTNGLVTAVSPGSATITVTTVDGGFTATCTVKVNDIAGTLNGHEWVDMGNGVKWARTNIGSNTELALGNLYAWGETYAKSEYTLANYEFYSGGTYSKYNSSDKKTVLDSVDDAATQNWGSGWRTPTDEEWRWLKQNCEWRYDSFLKVYVVTCSEPGYENYGIVIPVDELYVTYYWSANRCNYVSEAVSSQFSAIDYTFTDRSRYYGSYVRPVAD